MSIKSLVRIDCTDNLSNIPTKMDFSFRLVSLGLKYKLGLDIGSNMSPKFYNLLKDAQQNEIIIELLDSPVSADADILFLGDGITLTLFGSKIDTSESLFSRMTRLQCFFKELLGNENVKGISVDIDALNTFDGQEFDKLDIKVSDFANTMVELFKKHDQWTPTVRINFIK